jgi:CRP-like cAMP-binding protein
MFFMDRHVGRRGPAIPPLGPGDGGVLTDFRDSPNEITVVAGTTLFREGGLAEFMYVLLEGTVDIVVGGTVIESAEGGTVLGEMAIIDGAPRSATAIARTPCRLASVTAAQFDLLVQEKPELARFVMRVLSGRLRRMNQRLLEAFTEISVR